MKEQNRRPEDWLTVNEIDKYVRTNHKRHWSKAYIYSLMQDKLKWFKFGSTRVLLKEDIDNYVKTLKRPSSPYPKGN